MRMHFGKLRRYAACFRMNPHRNSTPDRIRTCGLWFRKPLLYPTELPGRSEQRDAIRITPKTALLPHYILPIMVSFDTGSLHHVTRR